jgi:hypothetical protein
MSKRSYTMTKWFYSRDTRMVQHMEIHKYNTVHKQMQGQKPNDSLIEKKL